MCQIEKIAAAMWKSGKCEAWYGSSDAHIRQVSFDIPFLVPLRRTAFL